MYSEIPPRTDDPSGPPGLPMSYVIALHLIPGIVFSTFLVVLSDLFTTHGHSAYLAELLAIPICLGPLLAGMVFLWSRRGGERRSLLAAVGYRQRGLVGDIVLWPIILFVCWAVLSVPFAPLTGFLESRFFGWFPEQLSTQALISGVAASPSGHRPAMFILAILLSGLLAPLLEEAYFRGFLLPRMSHLGWKAPVVNAFLFGLYHFFTPWSLPAIFVAFLPVAFLVQAKKDFRIGLVVHAMFNLVGVFTIFRWQG